MMIDVLVFIAALTVLLFSANFFTRSAIQLGAYFKLPSFVIGVFIVGIGTSLPELISAVISVVSETSEIVPGNIIGANISNLLLITGVVALISKNDLNLGSKYLAIDLHYLIGAFFLFTMLAIDGQITWVESLFPLAAFMVYCYYLIKSGNTDDITLQQEALQQFPWVDSALILVASAGIYFGAEYTVSALGNIAGSLGVPASVIALTLLSLGTTLPELTVNITAIRNKQAELAIGNILGSTVFNTFFIPSVASFFGVIQVPQNLLGFALPVMLGAGVFFYLLTQDKKISKWEGLLFLVLYAFFIYKTAQDSF